jgi:hypothetical protein
LDLFLRPPENGIIHFPNCFLFEVVDNGQNQEASSVMQHCQSSLQVKYVKAYMYLVAVKKGKVVPVLNELSTMP